MSSPILKVASGADATLSRTVPQPAYPPPMGAAAAYLLVAAAASSSQQSLLLRPTPAPSAGRAAGTSVADLRIARCHMTVAFFLPPSSELERGKGSKGSLDGGVEESSEDVRLIVGPDVLDAEAKPKRLLARCTWSCGNVATPPGAAELQASPADD